MGYDLGMYFLSAYNQLGEDYADGLSEFGVETIQTPLHFERRGSNGGHFNNKVMFVKFGADGALEKRIY